MGNKRANSVVGYGMAIQGGQRSGKMQELVNRLRSRCEELDRQCRVAAIEIDQAWHCYSAAETERDEARQWANRRTRMANALLREHWELERDVTHLDCENAKLRAQLAEAQESKDDMALDLHTAENQLAEARNKVLDEVIEIMSRCAKGCWDFAHSVPVNTHPWIDSTARALAFGEAKMRTLWLKDSAAAYTADEISTVAEARNKTLATNRAVIGALQSAIDAHGPIDKSQLTSAAKRILGALNGGS